MSAQLEVNMIACDGRGLCAEVLPEVVTLDDWGFPIVAAPVPPRLEDQAEEAVRLCPVMALRLERRRDPATNARAGTRARAWPGRSTTAWSSR